MPTIRLETMIAAPAERCFDLARDVDLHQASTARSRERAVAGVTRGLLQLGDEVTWEAVHFGLRLHLTSRITDFDRPHRFVDQMVRGPFRSIIHQHLFSPAGNATRMVDVFDFRSPFGPLGHVVDLLFLRGYMCRFLERRNAFLKQAAERRP